MTQRKRSARRAGDRAQEKLSRDLEKLAKAAPGGSPERPIVVSSPSEVEVHAAGMPCPICQSGVRVEEHRAETIGGIRLRVAAVACSFCRARREVYFQLAGSVLN
ncbi:MAG: hypothetical protein R3B70_19085 [Polyangiaceae bacterium]